MSHKVCITLVGSAQDPIRLVRPGRSLCATSNFDLHTAGQQVVREAALEGVEIGELRFLGI